MQRMAIIIGLMVPLSLATILPASAGEQFDNANTVKPYYYQPPGRPLNSTDQQRLNVYRNQLQQQQQNLQLRQDRGTIGQDLQGRQLNLQNRNATEGNPALINRRLLETQSELDRVNRALAPTFQTPGIAGQPSPPGTMPVLPSSPLGLGTPSIITPH
jgi:hypothetical protein